MMTWMSTVAHSGAVFMMVVVQVAMGTACGVLTHPTRSSKFKSKPNMSIRVKPNECNVDVTYKVATEWCSGYYLVWPNFPPFSGPEMVQKRLRKGYMNG